MTIHILRHGLPLCEFSHIVPVLWPEGHVWVNIHDKEEANCPVCIKKLEENSSPSS